MRVLARIIIPVVALSIILTSCKKNESATEPVPTDDDKWFTLPQLNQFVAAMTIYNGDLVVAGYFTKAGETTVHYIARWDGTTWYDLGGGVSAGSQSSTYILSLTVYNNKLIAGGHFTSAGGASANNVAAWDGTSWTPLGSGITVGTLTECVYTLAVYHGDLYAGGIFTAAGQETTSRIARWDGTSWHDVSGGIKNGYILTYVQALEVYNDRLIVGGNFTRAGSSPVNNVAAWDGVSWSSLDTGTTGGTIGGFIHGMEIFGGGLVAGGDFTKAGDVAATRIALWNDTSWTPVGSGVDGTVSCLTVFGSRLIAGGQFRNAGGGSANYIARWDGSGWQSMGSGVSGGDYGLTGVMAMAVYNSKLIVGGNFKKAGGKTVGYIAGWQD